jgi:hypothetical protein
VHAALEFLVGLPQRRADKLPLLHVVNGNTVILPKKCEKRENDRAASRISINNMQKW